MDTAGGELMQPWIVLRDSRAAWVIAACLVLTHAVLVVLTPGISLISVSVIAGLLGLAVGAAILMLDGAPRMSRGRAAAVIVTVALTTAVVEHGLPFAADLGWAGWHFGALTFLLLAMAVRGRAGMAWAGLAAMFLVTLVWALAAGGTPIVAAELILRHAGTLLVGTWVAMGLGRMGRRLDRVRGSAIARAATEASAAAAEQERRTRIDGVLERAMPVLAVIASEGGIGEEDRVRARVLEAALRDEIRVPGLVRQRAFTDAVEAARRAGREVLLLDDAEDAPETRRARDRLTLAMAPVLAGVADARMTLRFSGRPGAYRLTLVSDHHDEVLRWSDEDGVSGAEEAAQTS